MEAAKKSGILRGALTGVSGGLTFGIMFGVYGLGFWYGVKLIMDDIESEECKKCFEAAATGLGGEFLECLEECKRYDAGDILTVFFCVLIGAFQIGQGAPYVEALATVRSAAYSIFEVIDRKPPIDSSSKEGKKPESLIGKISFKNIFFNYPSRKDAKVLQGFNLDIKPGETVALVGPSGCGKSTCIQLVQRFYDPISGSVELDGNDIKSLNIGWLRDNIGVVSQEPVLFDCTIAENIRFGKEDATDEEIERVTKEANAFDFIVKLPSKFNTQVGEGGTQLSGGQKQRIAIARALIRNPQILLLDEATSALDLESEGLVQAALDKAQSGRTTIIVAHRLSTIRNADTIFAINNGQVAEKGTHNQLMENEGLYYSLVTGQVTGKQEIVEEKLYPDLAVESVEEADDSAVKFRRAGSTRMSRRLSRQMSTVKDMKRGSVVKENKDADEDEDEEEIPKPAVMRLMKENAPEWPFIAVGMVSSIGMGAMMPIFAEFFGNVLGVVASVDNPDKARADSEYYAVCFALLGLFSGLTMFFQVNFFIINSISFRDFIISYFAVIHVCDFRGKAHSKITKEGFRNYAQARDWMV